jgi:hypothetical protein
MNPGGPDRNNFLAGARRLSLGLMAWWLRVVGS